MNNHPQLPVSIFGASPVLGVLGLNRAAISWRFFFASFQAPARIVLNVVARCGFIDFRRPRALTLKQFRPNLLNDFTRKHLEPRYLTVGRLLDRKAEVNRHGAVVPFAFVLGPSANIWGVRPNCPSQCASASAFKREVSFQVHAAQYSDSLSYVNSDSHIDAISVLL